MVRVVLQGDGKPIRKEPLAKAKATNRQGIILPDKDPDTLTPKVGLSCTVEKFGVKNAWMILSEVGTRF